MPRFLSDEWLDALGAALADASVPDRVELALRQVVTGGPDGEVRYMIRIGAGRVVVARDDSAGRDADVTLTQDWETAVAVHRGELDAQDAFMTGRVRVGGDMRMLMRHQDALASLDGATADLRARTTYA